MLQLKTILTKKTELVIYYLIMTNVHISMRAAAVAITATNHTTTIMQMNE